MRSSTWNSLLDQLPRGGLLDDADWQRRHRLVSRVLLAHVPLLAVAGLLLGHHPSGVALALIPPAACVVAGHILPGRRSAAVAITTGLVYCSTALTAFSGGSIEAHFHFFIIIGFIALYQDWAPFLVQIGLNVLVHGVGGSWRGDLIFNHAAGQANPWLWAFVHGIAVFAACVGLTIFWRITEDSQTERNELAKRLAQAEIERSRFVSDLLVNLARRNQSMLHRQMEIINELEETEHDPEQLAELFRLDHLTTRVRRNAESLLVLSGEQPSRVWREPVALRDIVRAAIAETEDLERVEFAIDDRTAVAGHCVADLTHLIAELTENAVRFSPPGSLVTIRSRPPTAERPDGCMLTVEDWGLGMPQEDIRAANALLAQPPEIDLSVAQRLGFHVVARLAARHDIAVALSSTPVSGVTAIVHLPASLLEPAPDQAQPAPPDRVPARNGSPTRELLAGSAPGTGDTLSLESLYRTVPATERVAAETPIVLEAPAVAADGWAGWWKIRIEDGDVPVQRAVEPASLATRVLVQPERPEQPYPSLFVPQTAPEEPVAPQAAPPHSPATPQAAPPASMQPVPTTAGPPHEPAADHPDSTVHGLHQRVPQASLAPELRRTDESSPYDPGPRVAPATVGALSRYQASRRSAQAAVDAERVSL